MMLGGPRVRLAGICSRFGGDDSPENGAPVGVGVLHLHGSAPQGRLWQLGLIYVGVEVSSECSYESLMISLFDDQDDSVIGKFISSRQG